jgi:hypothetical protein
MGCRSNGLSELWAVGIMLRFRLYWYFFLKMPRQRVRVRRRAASTDLTERDPATLTPELNDQPRGRKRARINPPSTLTNFSDATEPPASQTIVNQGQLTPNSSSNCRIYDYTAEGRWPAANSQQW